MLAAVIDSLHASSAVAEKVAIERAYAPAVDAARGAAVLGDDCAALKDPRGGHLLLAAEGMLESFVASDPWFAGYSAVMVNVGDVAAMGGRPIAVVDVLWTPDHAAARPVWDGMTAAAAEYEVPIVGGHTTVTGQGGVRLAASVLGRADALLTSSDARPGDELLVAVDLRGRYRGDAPFWDATAGSRHREALALLPRIAESGWCRAAKDISNGGIVGTLVMLLQCSRVGARLDLDALPRPDGVDLVRWLVSFPSYGFLLSVPPAHAAAVRATFQEAGVECRSAGTVTKHRVLDLESGSHREEFWRA
ncbi:MAG: sll0787 family AIR synthase-like protein [Planctomycetota bacterium]|jgi:AIR synthase-related protein